MDDYCIFCEHPAREHWGSACHKSSFLRGSCDCTFVEQPPLPEDASPNRYRQRAEWWKARVRITDDHIIRASHGSERWRRLEAVRESAHSAAERALAMAELAEAKEARERASREAVLKAAAETAEKPAVVDEGRNPLDDLTLSTIAGQPLCTLETYEEQFDLSIPSEQLAVRNRLAAEFNDIPPAEKREMLEDEDVRSLLEHIGVVSRWTIGVGRARGKAPAPKVAEDWPEEGSPEWADEIVRIASDPAFGAVFDEVQRQVSARKRFVQQLEAEYGETAGDRYWAQTEADDPMPRDEAFVAEYERTRPQIEAYWQNWALAPSPALQQALMRQDPEKFKRHMSMAIQLLTPPEKYCFTSHDELFGWIASGMKPLIVDGERIPLTDIIEPRYLAVA